jgi:hypothetical protein
MEDTHFEGKERNLSFHGAATSTACMRIGSRGSAAIRFVIVVTRLRGTGCNDEAGKQRHEAECMISGRPQPEWFDLKELRKYACTPHRNLREASTDVSASNHSGSVYGQQRPHHLFYYCPRLPLRPCSARDFPGSRRTLNGATRESKASCASAVKKRGLDQRRAARVFSAVAIKA